MTNNTLIFISGIIAILTTRTVIDIRHVRDAKYRRERNVGHPTISYLIDLKRSADTIMPLLDHLAAVSDGRAEAIVLVRHTAGPRARAALQRYQRRNQRGGIALRIVRHSKGMDTMRLIRQYARGTAVMQVDTITRLSRGFGRAAAAAFSDLMVSFAVPRRHMALDRRIASGIQAGIGQWQHAARQLFDSPAAGDFTKEVLYRKTHLLRPIKHPRTQYMSDATVFSPVPAEAAPESAASLAFRLLAPLAILSFMVAFVAVDIRALSPAYLIGLYVGGYCVSQFGVKHYSLLDHLNLLLISPLVLVAQPAVIIRSAACAAYRKLRAEQPWRAPFSQAD